MKKEENELKPNKTLYNINLHEQLMIDGACITRVPGGWLYVVTDNAGGISISLPPVFVPYCAYLEQ